MGILIHSVAGGQFLKNFARQCRYDSLLHTSACLHNDKKTIKNTQKITKNIGFIGDGNMAKAIYLSMERSGLVKPTQIYVASPYKKNLAIWKEWKANITLNNSEVVSNTEVIFLAVKPYVLAEAVSTMHDRSANMSNKLFISILAGITLNTLENMLAKFPDCRVIRVMPNTPMLVGEGCSVYCLGKRATKEDASLLESILNVSGIYKQLPENMINPVSGLSGSGPSFVFLMIEALSDGGVRMGLHREMATTFAAQTVLGAAKLVLETGKHPGILKDEVCSAGGTTIAGMHALERGGVRAGIMNAVEAATKRAEELGKKE